MHAIALPLLCLLLHDANPSVVRQGQFERRTDEAQVLGRRVQALLEPRGLDRLMARPGQPVDLLEADAQRRLSARQAVLTHEGLVDLGERAIRIRHRDTVGDQVEQALSALQAGAGQDFGQ